MLSVWALAQAIGSTIQQTDSSCYTCHWVNRYSCASLSEQCCHKLLAAWYELSLFLIKPMHAKYRPESMSMGVPGTYPPAPVKGSALLLCWPPG